MKTTYYAHAKKNIFKKNNEFAIFTRFYLVIGNNKMFTTLIVLMNNDYDNN